MNEAEFRKKLLENFKSRIVYQEAIYNRYLEVIIHTENENKLIQSLKKRREELQSNDEIHDDAEDRIRNHYFKK